MENDAVEKTVKNYIFVDRKAKTYYQANKKIQKRFQEYYKNLSGDEKIKNKKLC